MNVEKIRTLPPNSVFLIFNSYFLLARGQRVFFCAEASISTPKFEAIYGKNQETGATGSLP